MKFTYLSDEKTNKECDLKTKIVIKSDNQTPFGGIFYVLNQFDRFLGAKIDKELGL